MKVRCADAAFWHDLFDMVELTWQEYRFAFSKPLRTAHGTWRERVGVLVEVRDGNRTGRGEIAPLPWFGTETVEDALAFLRDHRTHANEAALRTALCEAGPCVRFGVGCALEEAQGTLSEKAEGELGTVHRTALLPSGAAARDAWNSAWSSGIRTFKWKIGVCSVREEQRILQQLLAELPASAHLRLDANGGLTRDQADTWIRMLNNEPRVQYLEQPMPPGNEEAMAALFHQSAFPIALDESIIRDRKNPVIGRWPSLFVVKPALFGAPWELRKWRSGLEERIIYSSAIEMHVGRGHALSLALERDPIWALGF